MVYPRDVPQLGYCYFVQPRFQKLGAIKPMKDIELGWLINRNDSMRTEQRVNWSFVGFLGAGLASALVTILERRIRLGWANPFGSLVFGIFLSICFWVFHGLRSVWKTTVFVLVSIAAASLAGGTAILLNGSLGYDRTHLREIMVGGCVGAFVILFGAMMLLFPKVGLWRSIVKSVLWASAGGVFAGIGTAASSAFHAVRMLLAPGRPDSEMSLLLVWQVGMAVVLALLARTEKTHLGNNTV